MVVFYLLVVYLLSCYLLNICGFVFFFFTLIGLCLYLLIFAQKCIYVQNVQNMDVVLRVHDEKQLDDYLEIPGGQQQRLLA